MKGPLPSLDHAPSANQGSNFNHLVILTMSPLSGAMCTFNFLFANTWITSSTAPPHFCRFSKYYTGRNKNVTKLIINYLNHTYHPLPISCVHNKAIYPTVLRFSSFSVP